MKNLLFLIFIIFSASLAAAEEPALSAGGDSLAGDLSVAKLVPVSETASKPATREVSPGERSLVKALGLKPSDVFAQEPKDTSSELDLPLPRDVLPESDIPLTFNNKVEYFINYFQTSARSVFAKWLSRSERYIPMMKEVLKKEGLPEDLVYLAMIESGFSPRAYSAASAVGPWQFMSATGKHYSLRIDQWIDERRDPLKSTIAAAMYLKELYGMFNNNWYLAAAGYNAGENKILRAIDMYNSRDYWELSKGSYLKRETKDYVPKLIAAAIIAKEPARYGFADVAYLPAVECDRVEIPSRTDLNLVARLIGVSTRTLHDLNPELRRWCTPPDYPDYELKIPKGRKELFESEYAKIPADQRYVERVLYAHYRAGKRDTLDSVAKRFGTSPRVIARLNHLKKHRRLYGKLLVVPATAVAEEKRPEAKPVLVAAAQPESTAFNKYYTVKKGDTLFSLARRFNVSARLLSIWNNLKTHLALRPGKRIIVAKYVQKKGSMVSAADDDG